MADTKGNDPKTGPAADTKSGPVKPPVLDLTARDMTPDTKPDVSPTVPPKAESTPAAQPKAEAIKPDVTKPELSKTTSAGKPDPKPASAVPPAPPKTPNAPTAAAPAHASRFPIAAMIGGGLLGLATAYGLAMAGYWPAPAVVGPESDPRIAQFASAIPELQTVTETTQSELAALNQRIASLETAEPVAAPAGETAAPVDLAPIEAEIAALSQRLDNLPAVPAPAPAPVNNTDALNAVDARLNELAARLGTAESSLRDLDTTVTETAATVASQPTDIGAVVQLPLIVSGLENAFATGRPYESELNALRTSVPQVQAPADVVTAAPTGLPRPDLIASRFTETLPAIIAARPTNPNAQWQDGALDWFSSAIALRPSGEQDGDSPEAVTSRLEGAIARRDFATAQTLFAALPAPMQAAAGDLPAMVTAQAEATKFLETLRTQALSGEAAQ